MSLFAKNLFFVCVTTGQGQCQTQRDHPRGYSTDGRWGVIPDFLKIYPFLWKMVNQSEIFDYPLYPIESTFWSTLFNFECMFKAI